MKLSRKYYKLYSLINKWCIETLLYPFYFILIQKFEKSLFERTARVHFVIDSFRDAVQYQLLKDIWDKIKYNPIEFSYTFQNLQFLQKTGNKH